MTLPLPQRESSGQDAFLIQPKESLQVHSAREFTLWAHLILGAMEMFWNMKEIWGSWQKMTSSKGITPNISKKKCSKDPTMYLKNTEYSTSTQILSLFFLIYLYLTLIIQIEDKKFISYV